MSAFSQPHSPRYYKAVVLGLVALIVFVVGLTAFVVGQGRTQHRICQVIGFVGDSTQHGIDTNRKLILHDIQLGTKPAAADAQIRRQSITQATNFLVRVRRVRC